MTEPMRRFENELDAAVVRARRVAAQARETSAKFRRETRALAEGVQARTHQDEVTDPSLRRTASGFRTDHGLPVRDLPDPAPPTTPGPLRTTGSGRRTPRPSDDDEDFSQEQIMW